MPTVCAIGLGKNEGVRLHVCGPSVPQVLTLLLLDLTLLQATRTPHSSPWPMFSSPEQQACGQKLHNSSSSSSNPSSLPKRKENVKVVPTRERTKCTDSKLLLLLLLNAMDMNTENLSKRHLFL